MYMYMYLYMYLYRYMYLYLYTYMWMYMHMYMYMFMYMYMYIYIYMYMYMYLYMYMCMYMYRYRYLYMYMWMYIYIYVYVYCICMYIYTYSYYMLLLFSWLVSLSFFFNVICGCQPKVGNPRRYSNVLMGHRQTNPADEPSFGWRNPKKWLTSPTKSSTHSSTSLHNRQFFKPRSSCLPWFFLVKIRSEIPCGSGSSHPS